MRYILEFSALKYLLEDFPKSLLSTVWIAFETGCNNDTIISDRETHKLAEIEFVDSEALSWLDDHKKLFKAPSEKEAICIGEMMSEGVFRNYESNPNLTIRKLPEGVPFIMAMALVQDRTVVYRKNGRDSTLVCRLCKSKDIKYIEVVDFLTCIGEASARV